MTSDGEMPLCPGWSVAAMATVRVVDGPGDAGCLIAALGASDPDPDPDPDTALASLADWGNAVERTGGAVVVSLPALPENLAELDWPSILTGGAAHGGFVPAARPSPTPVACGCADPQPGAGPDQSCRITSATPPPRSGYWKRRPLRPEATRTLARRGS